MAIYNPLDWRNENALSGYPLDSATELQDFIVDAKFVQFDNFVPTLNYAIINKTNITLSITFDYGENAEIILTKDRYLEGENSRAVRVYQPSNMRYLGTLSFGNGVLAVWDSYEGRKLTFNTSFMAETVRSIPSNDAVYVFDGSYGDVTLGRVVTDNTVFYNISTDLNAITFNAVGGHGIPYGGTKEGLRKINLVPPKNNNINIKSNDIIKINALNSSSLTVSLVSGSVTTAFTIPTLIA